MKINSVASINFKGILDSKEPIGGKYIKYTSPLTRSTQQYERIYNGSDIRNVAYLQYVQGLYGTFIKEEEGYRYAATYIPFSEASELHSKSRQLTNSVSTVLKIADQHKVFAQEARQKLLDEFDKIDVDAVFNIKGAFKTVDTISNKTTIAIPTKDYKRYDIYELDSSGSLERALKGIEYFPNGDWEAREVYLFDLSNYSYQKDVKMKNGVTEALHTYTFDVFKEDNFTYSYMEVQNNDTQKAECFVEYEKGKVKSYNTKGIISSDGNISCEKRYEFYSKGNFSCMYGCTELNSNPAAEKMFVFENGRMARVESKCKPNFENEWQGEHIIVLCRDKGFKPKEII